MITVISSVYYSSIEHGHLPKKKFQFTVTDATKTHYLSSNICTWFPNWSTFTISVSFTLTHYEFILFVLTR